MKSTLVVLSAFIFSTASAYEGVKSVRGVTMTCDDLQSLLQQEGALNITSGRFNWGVVHQYYADGCRLQYASPSRVRTQDRRSCFAGYVCLKY